MKEGCGGGGLGGTEFSTLWKEGNEEEEGILETGDVREERSKGGRELLASGEWGGFNDSGREGEREGDGSHDSHSMSMFPLDERESPLSLRKGVERGGGAE